MSTTTYSLQYDGQLFLLSQDDYAKLRKVYDSGLSVSSILFRFTPIGSEDQVEIAVGSGAQFVLKRNASL